MAESTKPAKATLPKGVFGVDVPNHELLKLAYDAFLANSRQASATTKTRGGRDSLPLSYLRLCSVHSRCYLRQPASTTRHTQSGSP